MTSHRHRVLAAIPAALCLALSASTGALAETPAGDTRADYPATAPVAKIGDTPGDFAQPVAPAPKAGDTRGDAATGARWTALAPVLVARSRERRHARRPPRRQPRAAVRPAHHDHRQPARAHDRAQRQRDAADRPRRPRALRRAGERGLRADPYALSEARRPRALALTVGA